MKYMLMMHAPRGEGDWAVLNWPPEDRTAHIDFMKRLNKELLAGYWIVEVESAARAYEIAARASAAPGPGGMPLSLSIEVREVLG